MMLTIITGSGEYWLNQVGPINRNKDISILITKILWSILKMRWGYDS